MTVLTQAEAQHVVFLEARLLDEQRFEEWLELFVEDVLYWMPAWKDDTALSSDPDRELSLVYYRGKENLKDRVDRLRSGLSPVSRLLPRVVHSVTNVMVDEAGHDEGTVFSSFVSHAYAPRTDRVSLHFGQYEHGLVRIGGEWRIARKIIRLANDLIPTVLDVNAI
ncbi:MAG: aromatic-ring-hydroxylating dioxygenase subunit beta [Candidatus Andeanibacterium colombiense]|uniref:Aromatic-ring-hydroxylating dioxygenase subunit beta n=1 Tax=Candidatus Andeanibacterium colombiense TaxID=3121345 RepID=A0AAJ6BPF6_9SPHN|nr:MAG: aromatic-ring-hydroxylating dioxygenase subunit beta [Sphingomonadaceae bacterium]